MPISFVLVARPGVSPAESGGSQPTATPGPSAACGWMQIFPERNTFPDPPRLPQPWGCSTTTAHYDAAICAPIVAQEQPGLAVLAENIGDNPGAVTRFVLVSRPGVLPERTGADKTTVVVPLPEDRPGALMEILDQFATRGVNLSRIESRPTGQYLGHYFFSIDADGHVGDARVADALAGLHRISPATRFLGSYGRADAQSAQVAPHTSDQAFQAAHEWVGSILHGASRPLRNRFRGFAHSVGKCRLRYFRRAMDSAYAYLIHIGGWPLTKGAGHDYQQHRQ